MLGTCINWVKKKKGMDRCTVHERIESRAWAFTALKAVAMTWSGDINRKHNIGYQPQATRSADCILCTDLEDYAIG